MTAIKQIKLGRELSVKILTLIFKNETKSLNINQGFCIFHDPVNMTHYTIPIYKISRVSDKYL